MTDERIIAYLLRELPEEKSERFEDECFASQEWPAQIGVVEEELIDDYLSNALTPEQRRSFESNYLTTAARVERVRIAAALLRHVDACAPGSEATATPSPVRQNWGERLRAWWGARPRMMRAAAALAVLVIAVIPLWLSRPTPPVTFATLTLTVSNSDRATGVQPATVKLTRDIDAVRIFLTLPDTPVPAAHYRAQLEDDNQMIKLSENVRPKGRSVQVTAQSSKLAPGQYVLKLFAVRADGTEQRLPGSYFFSVE